MRLQHGGAGLRPGHRASYAIWVWSPAGAQQVSVDARVSAPPSVGPASFTVCPAPRGHVCTIATLPAAQAFELLLTVPIGRHTHQGRYVTVSVLAQAPDVSPAQATVATAVAPAPAPHSTPQPTTTTPAPTASPTAPDVGNPSLPAPTPASTVTPGSLPGLFPTVTPSAQPTPGARSRGHHRVRVTLTSATLPLTLRLIGGQLAGLAVLAAAITMVIARLSLRRPKLAGRPAGSPPAAPPHTDATNNP